MPVMTAPALPATETQRAEWHWTNRSLAARFGVGKDAIARVWADHNLKPWRWRPPTARAGLHKAGAGVGLGESGPAERRGSVD